MRKLETFDWWSELVALKDAMPLRELAERFDVTPGAISAALRRTNTGRKVTARAPVAAPASAEPAPEPVEGSRTLPRARAAGPDRPAPGRNHAWQVVVRADDGDRLKVVVAPSLVDAARLASRAGEVVGLTWVGEMIG